MPTSSRNNQPDSERMLRVEPVAAAMRVSGTFFSDDDEDYSDSKNIETGTTSGQVISEFKIVSRVLNESGTFYGVEFHDIVNMISVDKNTPTEIIQAISRYEAMLKNSTQSISLSSDFSA